MLAVLQQFAFYAYLKDIFLVTVHLKSFGFLCSLTKVTLAW